MIIKNPKHRGKRTCIKCLNCGEEFLELNTKIKEGKGKFCSNKCYKGTEFNEKNKGFVDHSHITNEVRGLLCSKCNSLLGMANDDIEILKKAIEYLKDKKTSFFDSINI